MQVGLLLLLKYIWPQLSCQYVHFPYRVSALHGWNQYYKNSVLHSPSGVFSYQRCLKLMTMLTCNTDKGRQGNAPKECCSFLQTTVMVCKKLQKEKKSTNNNTSLVLQMLLAGWIYILLSRRRHKIQQTEMVLVVDWPVCCQHRAALLWKDTCSF